MLLDKVACCLFKEEPSQDLVDEADTHPKPHSMADIGPPSCIPKPLLPSSTSSTSYSPRGPLGTTHSRQSISYPTFGTDSFDASEDESTRASPEKVRTSLQRLQDGILRRFSYGTTSSGSNERNRTIQASNITQDSVERRKELRRALHRRVEEELKGDKTPKPDSKRGNEVVPESNRQAHHADADSKRAKHRSTGSVSSKKSVKNMLDGLPTVAEHPDNSRSPSENEKEDEDTKDLTSAAVSVANRDRLLPEVFGKKAPQICYSGNSLVEQPAVLAPPVPELPEVFAKLKKTYARRSTSINGDESIYRPLYDNESKESTEKADKAAARTADEIFKPLDRSPRRIGLWTIRKEEVYERTVLLGEASPCGFGHDGIAEYKSQADEHSDKKPPQTQGGNFEASKSNDSSALPSENSVNIDTQAPAKGNSTARSKNLTRKQFELFNVRDAMKRMLNKSLITRLWNAGHDDITISAMSLPSLRDTTSTPRRDASPASALSFRTAPADLNVSTSAQQDRRNTAPGYHTGPETGEDPFVEETNLQAASRDSPSSMKRSLHQHSSSMQSETESFRAREIAAVSKRIVSQRWKDHPGRKSKFKEMLGNRSSDRTPSNPRKVVSGSPLAHQLGGLDGLEDERPSVRRTFTVSDYIKSQNSAGSMWERALQEHAFEMAMKNNEHRRKSTGLRVGASKSAIFPQKEKDKLSVKAKTQVPTQVPSRRPGSIADQSVSPNASPLTSLHCKPSREDLKPETPLSDASSRREGIISGQLLGSPSTPDSWVRFPSYSRELRNGPAGAEDSVSSFDFGSNSEVNLEQTKFWNSIAPCPMPSKDAFQEDSQRLALMEPVANLSTRFWRLASRMRRTVSLDLQRSARSGHRSSISTGGNSKNPELELLGLGTPVLTTVSDLEAKGLGRRSASLNHLPRRVDSSEEEIMLGEPPAIKAAPSRHHRPAKALANICSDLTTSNSTRKLKDDEMTLPRYTTRRQGQMQSDGSTEPLSSSSSEIWHKASNSTNQRNSYTDTQDQGAKSHVKDVIDQIERKKSDSQ